MTKADLCEVVILLDRSGSMSPISRDVIGGFRTFVDAQKAFPGECRLTLAQFDSLGIEITIENMPVDKVPDLVFEPRGGTPLFDAIGETINSVGARLARMPEDHRPGKVIFVIITDGEENQSRKFKLEQIRGMIRRQQDEWKWEFAYIGANVDAFSEAASLGIPASASSGFDSGRVRSAYLVSAGMVGRSRTGQKLGYTDDERAAMGGVPAPAQGNDSDATNTNITGA